MAMGYVAAGHGTCRFHEPRRMPLVSDRIRKAARYGRRLFQNRFRRAHPVRKRHVFRRLRPAENA